MRVAPDVAAALAAGLPVVGLESTLIGHGLPWPDNHAAAVQIEAAVREGGALPATVAVLDGELRVGLDAEALLRLARAGPAAGKASARDLGPALAGGGMWATTVAGTMRACALAGVRVFATGGIGGVHRSTRPHSGLAHDDRTDSPHSGLAHDDRAGGDSYDESADLVALATYPVAVVCAGAKAILDLPRTLERLETLGVTVIGLGTRELPAFYHNASGLFLEHVAPDAAAAARMLFAKYDRLGDIGGTLLANRVPREMDRPAVDAAIAAALARAEAALVRGKALTPFLLAALAEITGGESIATNVALVLSNARAAAEVAVAYAGLRHGR